MYFDEELDEDKAPYTVVFEVLPPEQSELLGENISSNETLQGVVRLHLILFGSFNHECNKLESIYVTGEVPIVPSFDESEAVKWALKRLKRNATAHGSRGLTKQLMRVLFSVPIYYCSPAVR